MCGPCRRRGQLRGRSGREAEYKSREKNSSHRHLLFNLLSPRHRSLAGLLSRSHESTKISCTKSLR